MQGGAPCRDSFRRTAQRFVDDACSDAVDLVAQLAEPLAEYMLEAYGREDWQNSPRC